MVYFLTSPNYCFVTIWQNRETQKHIHYVPKTENIYHTNNKF